MKFKNLPSTVKNLLKILAGILTLYILISGFVYIKQEDILFEGSSLTRSRQEEIKQSYPEVKEIILKTPDGINLHGWLADGPNDKNPLVIYFGGNNDEVSWVLDKREYFKNWSLLLINYRGYGLSEGQPGEQKLYRDAVYLYDTLSKRKNINSDKIVAMGRSLGTGVAVDLAAKREMSGTILVSPYDSMVNVAKSEYPFLPAGLILNHKFNSVKKAPDIKNPVLILVAGNDQLIFPRLSQKVYDKWGGEKEIKLIPKVNHSTIIKSQQFWDSVKKFLSEI
ncbi:MAG: alpha/beta hydrolase [Elusimicrobiota bacterium]